MWNRKKKLFCLLKLWLAEIVPKFLYFTNILVKQYNNNSKYFLSNDFKTDTEIFRNTQYFWWVIMIKVFSFINKAHIHLASNKIYKFSEIVIDFSTAVIISNSNTTPHRLATSYCCRGGSRLREVESISLVKAILVCFSRFSWPLISREKPFHEKIENKKKLVKSKYENLKK